MLTRRIPSQQQLYDRSPRWLQRLLVNAEALRREWFRRSGNYQKLVRAYDPAFYRQSRVEQEAFQIDRLNQLLTAARCHVPHYRANLPDITIRTMGDLQRLPILEKADIRRAPLAVVSEQASRRSLWARKTSGSTGTPLTFYLDREATRHHQAAADAMLAYYSCRFGERRARFSGAYVTPYEQTEPPFWIYVDYYRQFQCSAYHLAPQFYSHYLRALRDARVSYGTGYPTSWHLLATYLIESGAQAPRLRAIITDSEGISLEQQAVVERAFGCPVYQTYGTGEIGQVVWQCPHKRYHVLTRAVILEIVDDQGRQVMPGETGEIIATSLGGFNTPLIRYRTGDLATLAADDCACGWHSPSWLAIEGRVDDRVHTPDGRWIRVGGHVIKGAVGVAESQVAQVAPDQVVIRVVPDVNFDPAAMEAVAAAAHRYLGSAMQVSWEQVERLPRTRSGKLRHVVREYV
ncbi:phenylacetate--CoA ligase family protein [Chloroflexales bacterium ZM16-3]|nr:phenylacetate--CoA ligase family protein [Chloroflexales bacterium ZM16-3]